MNICYFIGIDIAKVSLDWAVFDGKSIVLQTTTANSEAGIKTALQALKKLAHWKTSQKVFCLEHTGIYNAHLLTVLQKHRLPIWLESSLQIKKAGGLQRGKTDTIDAQRIADRVAGAICLPFSGSNANLDTTTSSTSKISYAEFDSTTT